MSYVPSTQKEQEELLKAVGVNSFDELFKDIPAEVKLKGDLNLPPAMTELELTNAFKEIAQKNIMFDSIFRGAGAYSHFIPSAVKHLSSREEFVTAYTPYQAELNQGVLQVIFEYQTMICRLTGMDASNASLYDGPTAAAEAIAMCQERKLTKALISSTINPQTKAVVKTYCHASGIPLEEIPEKNGKTDIEALKTMIDGETAAVYIEQPNFFGIIEDAEEIGKVVKATKAKYIMGTYPISLAVLKTPAECGADIAVGEGQPLGMSLSFGGPYLGFIGCKKDVMRKLPGRICGQTTDIEGKRAFVLTLQAREQHIRREKASSNICSNQALCAYVATLYLSAMGPEGFKDVAVQSMSKAHYLASEMTKIDGIKLVYNQEFFNEFLVEVPEGKACKILYALEKESILGGLPVDDNKILWCATEKNTKAEMDKVISIIKEV